MLSNLIGGFIVILVGVTLAPVVANEVQGARGNSTHTGTGNITGASGTILGLTVLFYTLGVAVVAMGLAVSGLRQGGLM